MRYAIVITDDPDTAYRYSMLFKPFGLATKAVNSNAPMLSCILNPSSVLVLVEDGFIENTSAHTLIDLIRNTPGSNPRYQSSGFGRSWFLLLVRLTMTTWPPW